jgi:hypothetical protein
LSLLQIKDAPYFSLPPVRVMLRRCDAAAGIRFGIDFVEDRGYRQYENKKSFNSIKTEQ